MIIPPGKEIRFSKLFNQRYQKTVMVALDHGGGGVYGELEDLGSILQEVIKAKPDAVLLNLFMIRKFASLFQGKEAPALVGSLDINLAPEKIPDFLARDAQGIKIGSVKEAVRLGVDAVKLIITWGRISEHLQNSLLEWVGGVAQECSYWNLPLIIEPCLWGRKVPQESQKNPELMAHICRIAAEIGADILKVDYTGDRDSFRRVIDSSVVPVTVLGGPKFTSIRKCVSFIEDAMSAGAGGIVFGRSVFQSKDISKIISALREVVYRDNVKKAVQITQEIY